MRHHGGQAWGAPGDVAGRDERRGPNPAPDRGDGFDGTGVSVCMHLRNWEATAASMVAELPADPDQPMRAWAALGSPCVSVYVPLFPDHRDPATGAGTVPAVLADPAVWHRMDALRLRAEAARDGGDPDEGAAEFAAIRAVLAARGRAVGRGLTRSTTMPSPGSPPVSARA